MWDGKILVPYPIESQLSGVGKTVSQTQALWYHRTFRAPKRSAGERLLLHFGAVDWHTIVRVNDRVVADHEGGYDPFTVDITDAVHGMGNQELTLHVWDPTDKGPQPRGKQVQKPDNIYYTAVTGIWQTVWLEPVPATYVAGVTIVPDLDAGTFSVTVATTGPAKGSVHVAALAGGTSVATATGTSGAPITLKIPSAHAWSPSDPYLYQFHITLRDGARTIDSVASYAGLRKISVGRDADGHLRMMLNNQAVFQYGPLDQGWWPEGLYTAPTDAALKFDIEKTKQLGFNMIRKHVKVEPARWYYYADSLGILVWQDMPAGDNNTPDGKVEYERELKTMIDALRNHPSIIMWVPFNEGWGQFDTPRVANWVKEYDPTRLVNNASGWNDEHAGDVADAHVYPGPGMPLPDSVRVAVLGEFGGLGLPIEGHTWQESKSWGYRRYTTTAQLDSAYRSLLDQLHFMIGDGLSAAVYTQTTDVETEVNGLMTYDRDVIKLSPQTIAEHAKLYDPRQPKRRAVVESSWKTGQTWRYTTTQPDSAQWFLPTFADSAWQTGQAGFGIPIPFDYALMPVSIRTPWNTPDIWLRRTFTLSASDMNAINTLAWRIYHAEDTEIYINGVRVGTFPGRIPGYREIPLDAVAKAALRPGTNTIAVHVHKAKVWQYFDIGIDEITM